MRWSLAHVGSAQASWLLKPSQARDSQLTSKVARCYYCHPQIASLGITEKQAKERGLEYKVGKFNFLPNGKAQGLGEAYGFVKIIADAKYGEILGVHMIGPEVTELLPEWVLARNYELTPHEVGRSVHAHPTLMGSTDGSG
jgi:dihydrolipoamide dehydrogenase